MHRIGPRLGLALIAALGALALLVYFAVSDGGSGDGGSVKADASGEPGALEEGVSLQGLDDDIPSSPEAAGREAVTPVVVGDSEAVLDVFVKSADTGEPVPGAFVELTVLGEGDAVEAEIPPDERPTHGFSIEERRWARYRLPPGWRTEVVAWDYEMTVRTEVSRIAALAPGEHRTIELLLPTAVIPFHARVVRAEGGDALAGATVEGHSGVYPLRGPDDDTGIIHENDWTLNADDEGRFAVEFFPGEWRGEIWVSAPGHERTLVRTNEGHRTALEACLVPLAATATARFTVVDQVGNPVVGWTVKVWVPWGIGVARSGTSWSGVSDVSGRCVLGGLSATQTLYVNVRRDGELGDRAPVSMSLTPREVREIELRVDSGARVYGVLLGEKGRPVAGREVLLDPARGPIPAVFSPSWSDDVKDDYRVHTDASGAFGFAPVAPGWWWVGVVTDPLPPGYDGPDPTIVLAEAVHVGAAGANRPVTLRLLRGRTIRGRVVLPDGTPAAHAQVGTLRRIPFVAEICDPIEADGSFVLGPLPPGPVQLRAWPPWDESIVAQIQRPPGEAGLVVPLPQTGGPPTNDSMASLTCSELVTVQAGVDGIVLELQQGGALQGTVRDGATGEASAGEVVLTMPEFRGSSGSQDTVWVQGGEFTCTGLLPGRWYVVVVADDRRIAVGEAVVEAQKTAEIDLVLHPAAELWLHFDDKLLPADVRILQRGRPVFLDANFSLRSARRCLVPPGELSIVVRPDAPGESIVRTVHVAAGDELEVVFPGDD